MQEIFDKKYQVFSIKYQDQFGKRSWLLCLDSCFYLRLAMQLA